MEYRWAKPVDAALLAQLNQQLIADEGHRNRMTLEELQQRMADWLSVGGYQAIIFERDGQTAGYALFRRESDHVYLRQFFVCREMRRQGIGRAAAHWLQSNIWSDAPRIRLDVLVGNQSGIDFWRALGFRDYCLTMELDNGAASALMPGPVAKA